MSPGALAAVFAVPFYGALLCVAPAVTKPTVQFGVRIPPERTGATVIGDQRRAYFRRTAVVGVLCTVMAVLLAVHGSRWSPMLVVPIEVAADIGCLLVARRRITAVKRAERWFAGLRPTVVADTSWLADPPLFPVRWLIPALTVTAATVLVGVLRYPELPGRLADGFGAWAAPGHRVPKTPVTAFALVFAQLWVTALWTTIMLIIYRSRPDIEAADPAASVRRYRRFLARCSTAMLALVTLIDLSLLLAALRNWQVYRLSGARHADRSGRPGRRPVLERRPDLRHPRRPGAHGRRAVRRRLDLQPREPGRVAAAVRDRRRPGRAGHHRGAHPVKRSAAAQNMQVP